MEIYNGIPDDTIINHLNYRFGRKGELQGVHFPIGGISFGKMVERWTKNGILSVTVEKYRNGLLSVVLMKA